MTRSVAGDIMHGELRVFSEACLDVMSARDNSQEAHVEVLLLALSSTSNFISRPTRFSWTGAVKRYD